MDTEILFSETQKFRQWWLWFIVLGVNIIAIVSLFRLIIEEERFAGEPGTGPLIMLTALCSLFTILFIKTRLETTIRKDGVYVRFYPIHLKFKFYSWDQIKKIYLRQYAPLAEYGGWGVRFGIFGKGNALNVSGNKGLQIELSNNKKLLIGTNKPEALKDTLDKLGQLKQ